MAKIVNSILRTAFHNFEETAKRLKIDEAIQHKIAEPRERIELSLSPILPNGKVITIKAFVVRHNEALGPSKGGIRMTPEVTLDDVTGLSMEMTWKTALIDVPFGGGKAG